VAVSEWKKAVTPPFFSSALSYGLIVGVAIRLHPLECFLFQGFETSCKTYLGFVLFFKMNIKINKN
jgi:hypothetical protein